VSTSTAALPDGDPTAWPRIVTSVRPLPDACAPPYPHAATVGKPVLDGNGYLGHCVELPDVYRDTEAEARRLAGIAVAARQPAALAQRRASLADLLGCLPPRLPLSAQLARTPDGAVLRCGDTTFVFAVDRTGLCIALPRFCADADRIALLRDYAARLNADAILCRLELTARDCGFVARLPLERFAGTAAKSLCTAALMCCHALRCVARAVPPLPMLLDPDFQPLLRLARTAAAGVPVPFP
jgi:hypothetical protein